MVRVRDLLLAFFPFLSLRDASSPSSLYLDLWILQRHLVSTATSQGEEGGGGATRQRLTTTGHTNQLLPTMLMPLASAMR